jgi:hypothetical protein
MLVTMGIHQLNFRRYGTFFPGLPFFPSGCDCNVQLGEQRYGGSDSRFVMRWWTCGLQRFVVFDNRFLNCYLHICYIFLFAIREWWDCPRFVMAWVLLFSYPNMHYISTIPSQNVRHPWFSLVNMETLRARIGGAVGLWVEVKNRLASGENFHSL